MSSSATQPASAEAANWERAVRRAVALVQTKEWEPADDIERTKTFVDRLKMELVRAPLCSCVLSLTFCIGALCRRAEGRPRCWC